MSETSFLIHFTVLPNGIKANLAILKHCKPNGIPRMVIQKIQPINAEPIASSNPEKINHRILRMREPPPPPYSTSFPNGKNARLANLKHCKPIGIPTIVIHHKIPAMNQPSPINIPANRNQIRLPRHPISVSLL